MSNDTKLRSVFPNNNLKVIAGALESRVYDMPTDTRGPLEDIFYSSDVKIGLPTTNNQSLIQFPNTYKLIQHAWIRGKIKTPAPVGGSAGSEDPRINTYHQDYWFTQQVQRMRIKIPGVEMLDHTAESLIQMIKEGDAGDMRRRQAYLKLNGKSYTYLRQGDEVFMLIPLPTEDLRSGSDRKKPFPNHMLSEPVQITVDWVDVSLFSSLDFHFTYGDLATPTQYKQGTHEVPFKQLYPYSYAVENPSFTFDWKGGVNFRGWSKESISNDLRTITLTGLKPGETQELYIKVVQTGLAPSNLMIDQTGVPISAFQRDQNYINTNSSTGMKFGKRLRDISLRYAGQLIWQSEEGNNKMIQLLNHKLDMYDEQTDRELWGSNRKMLAPTGTVAAVSTIPTNSVKVCFGDRVPVQGVATLEYYTLKPIRNVNAPISIEALLNSNTTGFVGDCECVVKETATTTTGSIKKQSYTVGSNSEQYEAVAVTTLASYASVTELDKFKQLFGGGNTAVTSYRYYFAPHKYTDYVLKINLAELSNEIKDHYSTGVDFSYVQPTLSFRIDDDDADSMCAFAANCGQYTAYVTQSIQSILKYNAGSAILVQ